MYYLFWLAFIWRSFFWEEKFIWLPSTNKKADESLHFQRHTIFFVKLQCPFLRLWTCFLFIQFVFTRQLAEFFFYKKIQMKLGQNNKYVCMISQRVVQVWLDMETIYASGKNHYFLLCISFIIALSGKIIINLFKDGKVLILKVIFDCWKSVESSDFSFFEIIRQTMKLYI